MEIRRLQRTAGGTFIVTIPKEWAEKLKLKKGDLVSADLEENSIVVTPTNSKYSAQSHSLDIDEFRDQKLLELSITASFIQGHDITKIFSSGKMQPHQKKWVREAIEGLIGVEVSEDYADHVVLLNLVDPSKFNISELVEKFSVTAQAVLQDAVKALAEKDVSLAQDAFERGEESTKLYRLMMRLALQAARNRKLRDEMNLPDISNVIVMIIAIRELGRIAYYAMRIGQHVTELGEEPEEQIVSIIEKMSRITVEMQEQALKALLKRDLPLANTVIERMIQVRKLYENAQGVIQKQNEKTSLPLSLIVRDIRAIAGYAVALADDAVLGIFAR